VNIAGWNDPMTQRGLAGSVPSDSNLTSYHKAPGSEREYAQVYKHAVITLCLILSPISDLVSIFDCIFVKFCKGQTFRQDL